MINNKLQDALEKEDYKTAYELLKTSRHNRPLKSAINNLDAVEDMLDAGEYEEAAREIGLVNAFALVAIALELSAVNDMLSKLTQDK